MYSNNSAVVRVFAFGSFVPALVGALTKNLPIFAVSAPMASGSAVLATRRFRD